MAVAPDGDAARLRLDNEALRAEVASLRARVAELETGGGEVGHVFRALGYVQTPGCAVSQTVKQLLRSLMGVIVGALTFIGNAPYRVSNVDNAQQVLQRSVSLCIPSNFAVQVTSAFQHTR